ncbi:hypothetical protein [Helicobacter sp. 23-1045]
MDCFVALASLRAPRNDKKTLDSAIRRISIEVMAIFALAKIKNS